MVGTEIPPVHAVPPTWFERHLGPDSKFGKVMRASLKHR